VSTDEHRSNSLTSSSNPRFLRNVRKKWRRRESNSRKIPAGAGTPGAIHRTSEQYPLNLPSTCLSLSIRVAQRPRRGRASTTRRAEFALAL
jgi:hypothetical protein